MCAVSRFDQRLKKDVLEDLESSAVPEAERAGIMRALDEINRRTFFYSAFLHELKSLLPPLQQRDPHQAITILDIGAGSGGLLQTIHKWCGRQGIPVELIGLDLSANFAHQAEKRLQQQGYEIRFICGNAADLKTIGDNSFDIVISSNMVHHLRDPQLVSAMLSEIVRVAGYGWLVVDVDRRLSGVGMMLAAVLFGAPWRLVRDGIRSVRRAYRPEEINRFLQACAQDKNLRAMVCQAYPALPYWKIKGLKTPAQIGTNDNAAGGCRG